MKKGTAITATSNIQLAQYKKRELEHMHGNLGMYENEFAQKIARGGKFTH